jgi:hypothetical protein
MRAVENRGRMANPERLKTHPPHCPAPISNRGCQRSESHLSPMLSSKIQLLIAGNHTDVPLGRKSPSTEKFTSHESQVTVSPIAGANGRPPSDSSPGEAVHQSQITDF